jgi:hypothetical protein
LSRKREIRNPKITAMEENFEEQNKLPELKLGKDFFFRKKKKQKTKTKT